MRYPPAFRSILCWGRSARNFGAGFHPAGTAGLFVLAVVCIAIATVTEAQQFRFGVGAGDPTRPELSAPRIEVVSGPAAARLEQARALAADENWDEAVDIFRELAGERSDAVVEVDDGRFVSLRTYCHVQMARLPTEALATYRRRVDPLAERWYREGLAARDESLLRRVVDELFCSSWGDDALVALGELALERADYAAARCAWEQVSPLLRDPTGKPLWLALDGVDLTKHWPDVSRRWAERPEWPAWLAFPDTDIDLADVRFRLVLASIRAGELRRAELELAFLRHAHSDAIGRLGGQSGPYVAALERLLASAREWPAEPQPTDWPTFAGSLQRVPSAPKLGPVTGPIWRRPVSLQPTDVLRLAQRNNVRIIVGFGGGVMERRNDTPVRESQKPLSFFPVAADGVVYYSDATRIHAVDLATGRPAITRDGVLHRDDPLEDLRTSDRIRIGPGGWQTTSGGAVGVPRHTLTITDKIVYGRMGSPATARVEPRPGSKHDRLVGLNLRRDGALAFSVQPKEPAWAFDGVPVGDDRRVYVAMRHSDVTPHAYVACYDVATGNLLWRTAIGAADTPGAGSGDEITHNLLTLVGDRIYFNTNLGLVAALDARTGAICWLHRYERRTSEPLITGRTMPLQFERDPAPCLFYEGLIIVAPTDTPEVFALDAMTGRALWRNDQMDDGLHLLGVVRRNVIVGGHRLRGVDLRTGKLRFTWPESEHAGIRGMGRGLVAGDEVFWPTRSEIHVIHGVTGARSRPPISLASVGSQGANLAAAQGRLVVAGYDKLMAFGPELPVPPSQKESTTVSLADGNQ